MNIRGIEESIITKLKEDFSNFLVQGFPEKPQEFVLLHPNGAILVHYRGSNYSSTNALNFVSQEAKLEFATTIVTRNLRDNNGAYETLEKVRQILCGYKIPCCSKLTPTKEGFISEINGIWQYEIIFTLSTTNVENLDEGGI